MNWETAIAELIVLVKTTAPQLWTIARRQAYGDAWTNVIVGVAFALISVGATVVSRHYSKRHDEARTQRYEARDGFEPNHPFYHYEGGYEAAAWFLGAVAGLCLVVVFAVMCGAVRRFYNPDYYAIQVIIGLVK